LVLPNDLANTYDFLLWLREAGLTGVTLSLMSQYSPQYRAREYPELDARLPQDEYRRLVDYALEMGIGQVLAQGLESREHYLPNFLNDKPFER
ncbi:MAG: radical SAM protein, partial [Nitrospiraceae bacterium]|nr:radical SAM protein [Nitrospiraceae bacterium]